MYAGNAKRYFRDRYGDMWIEFVRISKEGEETVVRV